MDTKQHDLFDYIIESMIDELGHEYFNFDTDAVSSLVSYLVEVYQDNDEDIDIVIQLAKEVLYTWYWNRWKVDVISIKRFYGSLVKTGIVLEEIIENMKARHLP